MKPCYKILGLDRVLKEKKLSNNQLDRLLGGWSVSRVAHLRNGRDRATLEEVQAIAEALGVELEELQPIEIEPKASFFLANLPFLLKKKGISGRKLAELTDIPSGTIFHYIGLRHGAPLFRAEQIAIALGVDISALGLVTEKPVREFKRKIKKYLLSKLYFLLKERSKKGLTVSQLSELSGVRASRIAAASFQKMILSFEESQSIAKALGVDFTDLGPVEKEKVNWFDADAFQERRNKGFFKLEKLAGLMNNRKITLLRLATSVGVSVNRLKGLKTATVRATRAEAEAIAKALGVDFDELGPVEGRRAYFRRETYCVLDCLF